MAVSDRYGRAVTGVKVLAHCRGNESTLNECLQYVYYVTIRTVFISCNNTGMYIRLHVE